MGPDQRYGITIALKTLGAEGVAKLRADVLAVREALLQLQQQSGAGLGTLGPQAAAAQPALDALTGDLQAVSDALSAVGTQDRALQGLGPQATAARPAVDALTEDLQSLSRSLTALGTKDQALKTLGPLAAGARAPVAGLRDELLATAVAGRETVAALSMRSLNLRPTQEIRREIEAVNTALERLRQRAGAPDDLGRAANAAQARLAALQAELRGVDASAGAAASGGVGGLVGRLGGIVTAALAARAAIAEVREIIETGLGREALQVQFEFAFGGQAQAAQELAYVRGLAEELGLELESTARSYAKVAASSRGTQLEGQATRDIFRSIASAASVMKLSVEQTDGALIAIAQMMSKNVVSSEELRQQLAERIPSAYNIAARAMGVTTQELSKMLDTGQLLASEFLPKFAAELQRTLTPNLAGAEQSTQAQLQRLGNRFDEFKARIAASGVLEALDRQIALLIDRIQQAADDGSLQRWAETLGTAIGRALDVIGALISAVEHLSVVFEVLAAAAVGNALAAMAGRFGLVATAATSAAVATEAASVRIGAALARAVPLVVIGLAIEQIVKLTGVVAEYRAVVAESEVEAEKFAAAQEKIITATSWTRETVRLSAEQFAALTDDEKAQYGERLRAAEEYWRAVSALEAAKSAPTETSQAAMDALREAKAYAQAGQAVATELQQRIAREQVFKNALATEQAAQLDQIKVGLALQIAEYEKANKAFERARTDRTNAAKTNAQFIASLLAGGNTASEVQKPTALGVQDVTNSAKRSVADRDFATAIAQTEKAMSMIREMDKSGSEAKLILAGLAREIAAVDDQARAGQEQDAAQQVNQARQSIETLVNAAEAIKSLQVGFDTAGALTAAEAVRKAIQERLANNPVIVPVQLQQIGVQQGDTKTAEQLLGAPTKRAWGGALPGIAPHDRADNMLYWGTPGEWVIQRPAVRYYGAELFAMLNSMQIPRHAYGGMVGAVAAPVSAMRTGAEADPMQAAQLVVPGVGQWQIQARQSVHREIARVFSLAKLSTGRRS